jgi:AcrR family transcriptional regulator
LYISDEFVNNVVLVNPESETAEMPTNAKSTGKTSPPGSVQGKRERTRAQLINTAMAMLADNSLGSVSILELATAAGVSNGTFYNYFQTREELVMAAAARLSEQLAGHLRSEFIGVNDPAERIVIAARTFMERTCEEPVFGWALLRLVGTLPRLSEKVRQSILLDVREGKAKGRFHFSSEVAAADMVLGTLLVGIRSLLEKRVGQEHIGAVGEVSLVGLGMKLKDAKAIVARLARDRTG